MRLSIKQIEELSANLLRIVQVYPHSGTNCAIDGLDHVRPPKAVGGGADSEPRVVDGAAVLDSCSEAGIGAWRS